MLASKVTISEETRKMNQLSRRKQGQLRYKRLQELEKSGELSQASTRNELAEMVGYPKNDTTGISWVNNMVARGYISEHLLEKSGKTVFKEFHLTSKVPDYDFSQARARKKKNQVKNSEIHTNNIATQLPQRQNIRVQVEYCGMSLTIDNAPAEYVSEIIKNLK